MAHLTQCDNCEQTTRDPYQVGWWTVEPSGSTYARDFGYPDPPYTFCSWRCVAEYAAKREKAQESDRGR